MVNSSAGQSFLGPLMRRRSDAFISIGIFAVALLVRGVYLAESSDNPTFGCPIVDSSTYHEMAAELARTGQIGSGYFWQPFFYPFFLSVVYRLAGPSILVAKLVQALLGAATCLLSYLLGRRVFSRAVGIAAGLIVAFYGPLIFFETELLAVGWAAFWAVTLCLLLLGTASRPTIKCCLLLGLCSVLAVITRPTFLPFCAAGWIWLGWRWARQVQLRDWVVFTAALVAGFAIVAIPLGVCFRRATGRLTILPHSGGVNMYIGNNPNSRQTLMIRPGAQWEQLVEQPRREGIKGPWEAQAYFMRQVRQYLTSHPAGFAAGIGRKTLQFVSSREIPRNIDPYLFARWSVLLSVLNPKAAGFGFAFGLILPLALLGLMARGREVPGPFWLLLLAYPAAVITVFVAGRYRVAIVPVAAVMAAAGGGFIIQAARRRRWAVLGLSAVLVSGTVVLGSLPGPFWEEQANYEAEMYRGLGCHYDNVGNYEQAISNYDQAIELNPSYADAYTNRGKDYRRKGEYDQAIRDLNQAIELNPSYAKAYNIRGVAYYSKGQLDLAIGDYNKAIELNPWLIEPYNNRGLAYSIQGKYDQAIRDLDQAIELNPSYAEAYNSRGIAYSMQGKYDQAIRDLNQAIELNPSHAKAYDFRGIAYRSKGEYDQAIRDFDRAIELNPGFAEAYYNRDLAYRRKAALEQAIRDLGKTIELNPDSAHAHNSLAWILATCPEPHIRDGAEAVRLAERACELTDYKAPANLDTLAAAYAELGQFDQAVKTAEKALRLAQKARKTESAEGIRARMELYKAKRPYREPFTSQDRTNPEPTGVIQS